MFQDGIGAAGFFAPGDDDDRPFAYLNYLLFNEDFESVDAGAQRVDEDGEFESLDQVEVQEGDFISEQEF